MTYGIRGSDLAKLTEPERNVMLEHLVRHARSGGSATGRAVLQAKIRALECRYEMTSSEMLKKFRAREIRETAEISKWLFLISVRDCRVKA
jgi:molybdenum-dependent DNA-binding transcriptional regulator ModE